MRAIFREVFAACLSLELPAKVAYAGPEGSTAHLAARSRFGAASSLVAAEEIAGALDEVIRHRAEFAVVPLETRALGIVQETTSVLAATELKIVGTIECASSLHLMNRTGNVADIEKVYATAEDHARAQRFLATHPTRVSVLDVKSSHFACQIALEDHGSAALASEEFGVPLGLQVARRNVADAESERVRYAIVGSRPSSRTGDDVTAIAFHVQDTPGALLDVLRQFSERGINLVRIQSHPDKGGARWSYQFFVELIGHATDRGLVTAFEEVKRVTRSFKVLGSYPAAT
jgi:chorismate mutase/prephenate dehydratase